MGGKWSESIEERFNRKYKEKGGILVFNGMVKNKARFETIGQYFGFSRQRAKQYAISFGLIKSRLETPKIGKNEMISRSPRLLLKFRVLKPGGSQEVGRIGEVKFTEIFKNAVYNGSKASCDFRINGFNVEVKRCAKYWYPNPDYPLNRYYRFNLRKLQLERLDYVFVITPTNYYLIPKKYLKPHNMALTPKFEEFRIDITELYKLFTTTPPKRKYAD